MPALACRVCSQLFSLLSARFSGELPLRPRALDRRRKRWPIRHPASAPESRRARFPKVCMLRSEAWPVLLSLPVARDGLTLEPRLPLRPGLSTSPRRDEDSRKSDYLSQASPHSRRACTQLLSPGLFSNPHDPHPPDQCRVLTCVTGSNPAIELVCEMHARLRAKGVPVVVIGATRPKAKSPAKPVEPRLLLRGVPPD
jgi:hypothetical protein